MSEPVHRDGVHAIVTEIVADDCPDEDLVVHPLNDRLDGFVPDPGYDPDLIPNLKGGSVVEGQDEAETEQWVTPYCLDYMV